MDTAELQEKFRNDIIIHKPSLLDSIINNTFGIVGIIACLILFWFATILVYWRFIDTENLYIENPDKPGVTITPIVAPGGYVVVSRSVKRTSNCHQTATNWLVNSSNILVYTLSYQEFFGKVTQGFSNGYVMYRIPVSFPNGIYKIRPYISCENNPLYTSNQTLSDVTITVSDSGSLNRDFITKFFATQDVKTPYFVAP